MLYANPPTFMTVAVLFMSVGNESERLAYTEKKEKNDRKMEVI